MLEVHLKCLHPLGIMNLSNSPLLAIPSAYKILVLVVFSFFETHSKKLASLKHILSDK